MKPLFTLLLLTSSLFLFTACNEEKAETTNAVTPESTAEKAAPMEAAQAKEDAATEQPAAEAADPAAMSEDDKEASQLAYGHDLHEDNCARCHDPAFYMREDRKVQDRAGLDKMVRACDAQLGTSMFDEDMELLADYLDKTYYKFSN